MSHKRITPRQLGKLQQRAINRSIAKWFSAPDAPQPYASLAGVQPTGGARRPMNYC